MAAATIKYAFITVGTTRFDSLVEAASSSEFISTLQQKGFQASFFFFF
jgi:UDP-N-acetylglucosamine transferase subunit ALG13